MRIYSKHQASFLPWVGFWQKVANSDVFEVSIYDDFRKRTWQHHSYIGAPTAPRRWCIPLAAVYSERLKLVDVRVCPMFSEKMLSEFYEQHKADKYFATTFAVLSALLSSVERLNQLWLINLSLIEQTKHYLEISTPIIIGPERRGREISEVIATQCKQAECGRYLSGPHGRKYLQNEEFSDRDLDVRYQDSSQIYPHYKHSVFSTISMYGIKKTRDLIYDLRTN